MRLLNPVNRRSGVAASVINRNRNVQIPVRSRISSSGFALRLPVNVSNRSQPIGTELARKTAGLRIHQRLNLDMNLEVFAQVHSGIHRRDLVGVSVEHQRGSLEEITDAPFAGLAPPRMIHTRIYVRVKAIFGARLQLPGVHRLLVGEIDADDRFHSLESVLPGRYETNRRAILGWKRLAVKARREQSEWVCRFIQP